MPVTDSVDQPFDYVTISGPAVDALGERKESTSNPKIAARELRHNLDHVKDALFAEIRAVVRTAPRESTAHPHGRADEVSAFYISDKAIEERTGILRDIAHALLDSGTLPRDRLMLRQDRIPLLTWGYFLLNKAYKDWRIPAGQSNEPARIAALQAMTIARFQPFLPLVPSDAQDLAEARCNEIFALTYALGILKHDLGAAGPDHLDFWLRVLDIIAAARVETLDPFLADANRKTIRPLAEYALVVHPHDKPMINGLISIFELIAARSNHTPD
jgi:hypothetical protein